MILPSWYIDLHSQTHFWDAYNHPCLSNVGLQDGYAKIGYKQNDKREREGGERKSQKFLWRSVPTNYEI